MRAKKTRKPKVRRIHKVRRKQRDEVERLIELAKEPVLPGTGRQTFGRGPHVYMKGCTQDPFSMRIFRFRKHKDCARAYRAAVAADLEAEGRLDELDDVLDEGIAEAERFEAWMEATDAE